MKVGLMQNKEEVEALSKKWKFFNFKEILKDSSGGNIKIKSKDTLDEGILPVVDQGKNKIAGYTDKHKAKVKANLPLIVFGDHTRNLKYIDFEFAMGADGTKVLEIINSKAFPKFIYYYLTSINITNTGYNRHFKFLKDLVFPLPQLSVQKQIAQILDNAAALRDKTQQLLNEYDQLAQSIFLDMFGDPVTNPKGWEKVKFNKIFKQGKKSIKPEDIKDGQKYIGLEHIEKESGEILKYVSLNKGELKSNKFIFDENYVLYGKLRPYLNKVATPKFKGICSTDIIPFKPIESKSNRSFLSHLLKGKWFVEYANRRTSGANLPRVSPKEINKFQTINPPIKLQNQFADKIALIEQQKDLAKQELQESEDLFQALLQKAFKGELV